METLIVLKEYYHELVECYDWSLAKNPSFKSLYPTSLENKNEDIVSVFSQFDKIAIEEDLLFGIFNSGQKVLIAVAPFIAEKLDWLTKLDCQ